LSGQEATASNPGSLFSKLFETESVFFSIAGFDGYLRDVNPAFERLLNRSSAELLKNSIFELMHPQDINPTLQGFADLDDGHPEVTIENRLRHVDGSYRWLSWVAKSDDPMQTWVAVARDITAYRELADNVRELINRMELFLGNSASGGWQWFKSTQHIHLDESARILLGLPPGDGPIALQKLLRRIVRSDRRHAIKTIRHWKQSVHAEHNLELDIGICGTDAHYISLRGSRAQTDQRGRPIRASGLLWDISERKTIEQQLISLAMSDPLTGIANRRAFREHLVRELWRLPRINKPLTLLMLDVDDFKNFNDTHGHHAGDQALVAVANCIEDNLRRSEDMVGRFGGEEFAALLPGAEAIVLSADQRVATLTL